MIVSNLLFKDLHVHVCALFIDDIVFGTMKTCVSSGSISTSEIETYAERDHTKQSQVPGDLSVVAESNLDILCQSDLSSEVNNGDTVETATINVKDWGVLKFPVKVKIADLGNACWVVSCSVLVHIYLFICQGVMNLFWENL